MQEDTYNIVERSLWDFLQEMQKGIKQGYVLSEDNKHFPQAHISLFTCTLVKEEPVAEVATEVEPVKKVDGRKKVNK